jgi:DNA-directed RNA polymerase specialized sigma24 family protein
MSVELSFSDEQTKRNPSSRIWLNDVDPDGRPVDLRFVEAGYRKEADFFRYRRDELKDEAVVANLAERAVYRASRANKKEPLRDVGGYLFTVFTSLADREIARSPRTVSCEAKSLANFSKARTDFSQGIVNQIRIREILDAIDPTISWAIKMRTLGYEVQEIANKIDISADCLSTRMRRAIKRLLGDEDQ